jgi:hypothetical protein
MKKPPLHEKEKVLLATVDKTNYDTFICADHGLYQWNKYRPYTGCLFCHARHQPIDPSIILRRNYI